jgi:hypothetical protein
MVLSASLLAAALSATTPSSEMRLTSTSAESGSSWWFTEGREFPGASGGLRVDNDGVLHVAFDFTKGGAYVGVHRHLDEPAALRALTLRVKKPATASLGVRITDNTGQTVQKHVAYDHDDWQTLRVEMGGWTGHWGGADDGVLHPPIRTVGVLIESRDLDVPVGELLIADVVAHIGTPESPDSSSKREYIVTRFDNEAGLHAYGSGTLKGGQWRVDFSGRNAAGLYGSISFFGAPSRFRLRVRGGSAGNVLVMRLGSHFQGFEREVGVLTGKPQTFEISAPPDGWTFGGGENDGKVRYPLRFTGLSLRKGAAASNKTTLELVDLVCETVVPCSGSITLLANLSDVGVSHEIRTLAATCSAWNLLSDSVNGTLSLNLRDWEGNVIDTANGTWKLPAKGVRAEESFAVTVPSNANFAEAEFVFTPEDASVPPKRALATYTRPPEDPGDASLRPESPWGMGVYLYRYADNASGYALMERAAALAQSAGVKWSREEFSWGRIEPRKGEYDFAFYDRVVDTARAHGISVYALLAYWSGWTKPYTEEGVDDFVNWTRVLVRRYKDRIKHWEIYNEPNIFFWQGDKELYPVLLKKCYAAIKEEDPDALVLGISTAGVDAGFIRFCLDRGAPFDVLTVHPYRSELRDGSFMTQLRATAELVGNRPVWITEMGWSTQVGATDERRQAELLARCYLASVASNACQNVSWYNFRNDGNDPFYNEDNFGALRSDLTPKPAYRALMTVCRTLSTGTAESFDAGNGVLGLRVGDGLALWSPTTARRLRLRAVSGSPRVLNLMGDDITPAAMDGVWTLTPRAGSPVFVRYGRVELVGTPEATESEPAREEIRF